MFKNKHIILYMRFLNILRFQKKLHNLHIFDISFFDKKKKMAYYD